MHQQETDCSHLYLTAVTPPSFLQHNHLDGLNMADISSFYYVFYIQYAILMSPNKDETN